MTNKKDYSGWDVCMHFATLLDARRASYIYLDESAKLLSGENKVKLSNVSAMYKDMWGTLSSILPYKALNDGEYNLGMSAELREQVIGALQKMVELERQARIIISDILDHWDS